MTCDIQHLHFDCHKRHPTGYKTTRLGSIEIPVPEQLSPVEQLLWQFPPPWHKAVKNGSVEHSFVTWNITPKPSFGRVIVVIQASWTMNTFSAFSDLLFEGQSYQDHLGSTPFKPLFVIPIPDDMQAPYSLHEENWLNEQQVRLRSRSALVSPYSLTTTTRSILPVFLGLLHDAKSPDSSLSRLTQNAIYDRNIWSIVKGFAQQVSCDRSQLILSKVRSCKGLPFARTADGQHLMFSHCEEGLSSRVELVTFTVLHRETLFARFTIRRPLFFDHRGMLACMNSQFIALVFFDRKVIITTLTGEPISSFNVSPKILAERVFALHPYLPLIAVFGLNRFHIFDFDGYPVGQSPHVFFEGFALEAFFDAASESILVETTSGMITVPLSGHAQCSSPFAVHEKRPRFNQYRHDCTDLYAVQWVKPVTAKRKSPCD